MNKRFSQIRKAVKLSQEKFGEKLGVTGAGISKIESGDRGLTEQMIKSVCREFNVNETWLRTGEGDIFEKISPDNSIIDMAASAVKNNKESFQKNFLHVLSQLTEEQWSALENVMGIMIKNIKDNNNSDDDKA